MLGLLAVWPERLGAGCIGGASWAALLYCHFLAVPLSLSLLSPLSLPPVSGAVPWVVLALLSGWWLHGLGLAVLWPPAGCALLGWLWVQVLAACFSLALPCFLSLLGVGLGLWCCCLPLSFLLGAGVPLLSSGAGLLCAGAGCWPWVG